MNKWIGSRILWGLLLIAAGVVFLLQNLLGWQFGALFWSLAFGLGGVAFLSVFISNRSQWWAAIPGFTLLGIALTIFTDVYLPGVAGLFPGGFVLLGIALAFITVYLADRNQWWAIIPAGVMISIVVMTSLERLVGGVGMAGILFLGIGATFAVIALMPTAQGRLRWAWIPAGVMGLMGLIFLAFTERLIGVIGPLALIVVGVFFIGRAILRRG